MSPSRSTLPTWLLAPAVALTLAGCPAAVDTQQTDGAAAKSIGRETETDDLATGASAEGPKPGAGAPDESNGACRLFAERHAEPKCCPQTYGLGIEEVASVCGYDVFLGEYLREGCRYSFYDPTSGATTWIRLALLADTRPFAEVVEDSDKWLRKRKRDEDFKSTALQGPPSVAYNLVNPVGWALLGGWKRHRQATWKKGFCGDNFTALLQRIAAAPEPDPDSGGFRRALLPAAAPAPAEPAAPTEPAG